MIWCWARHTLHFHFTSATSSTYCKVSLENVTCKYLDSQHRFGRYLLRFFFSIISQLFELIKYMKNVLYNIHYTFIIEIIYLWVRGSDWEGTFFRLADAFHSKKILFTFLRAFLPFLPLTQTNGIFHPCREYHKPCLHKMFCQKIRMWQFRAPGGHKHPASKTIFRQFLPGTVGNIIMLNLISVSVLFHKYKILFMFLFACLLLQTCFSSPLPHFMEDNNQNKIDICLVFIA